MIGTRAQTMSLEEMNRILSEIYAAITELEKRLETLEGR